MPAGLSRSVQTNEEMFWRGLPLDRVVVYDVGAYHGILTLFFASRAARVIAYEPNRVNYDRLIENLQLNDVTNVSVRKLAVGSQVRSGTLVYNPSMAGGGTVDATTAGTVSQEIEITTLDHDITAASLPAPDLIKIDIEGWELEALTGARATIAAHHPALFLEMHGQTMREKRRKASEIVTFLRDAGYTNIIHVETGAAILPGNETLATEGHLYCQYTANRNTPWPINTSSALPAANSES